MRIVFFGGKSGKSRGYSDSLGVQMWDKNVNPNNYGIKPVSVYGSQLLANGQKSATWTVSVPAGLRLNFYHVLNNSDTSYGGMGKPAAPPALARFSVPDSLQYDRRSTFSWSDSLPA